MVLAETWRRFRANWAPLLLAGVCTALLHGLVAFVGAVTAGSALTAALFSGDFASLAVSLVRAASALAFTLVIGLLLWPLALGGLLHTVILVQRRQPIGATDFWLGARRHWPRLFLLQMLLLAVGMGLGAVGLVMAIIPLLGPLVWATGAGITMLALAGYGSYLCVAEELSAPGAVARGYRLLSNHLPQVAGSFFTLMAAALLAYFLTRIPVAGWFLGLALQILAGPLVMLYLAVDLEGPLQQNR